MPNLPMVEAIASDTPSKTVVLSGMTTTVLFTALDACNRLYDWQGVGFDLTQSEIDEIESILALARKELMTGMIGQIIASVGSNEPPNSLFCDGTTYERTDYPELYSALNSAFIVDSEHFIVPNLTSRFALGSSSFSSVGITGGEESHVLIESELPSHAHSIQATATTLAVEPGEVTVLTPLPIVPNYTGNTGGNVGHNNMPPYMTVSYYIVAR